MKLMEKQRFHRRGKYGSDIYTLRSIYMIPSAPYLRTAAPVVHLHWRRFHTSTIPLKEGQENEFVAWLAARWREKDILLNKFERTGNFIDRTGIAFVTEDEAPKQEEDVVDLSTAENESASGAHDQIRTEIRLRSQYELLALVMPSVCLFVVGIVLLKISWIFKSPYQN